MTVIWDDVHAEPCIRLTSPGFTITPYRQDDAGSLVSRCLRPGRRVNMTASLVGRPRHCSSSLPQHPVGGPDEQRKSLLSRSSDPESTIRASLEKARPWLDALELALRDPESPSEPILGFPFAAVRDPGGKLVGKVSLAPFEHDPRGLSAAEMLARTPAEQTWILGYKLHPEARGKGVASAAVQAIVNDWVRVYMRIGQVVAVRLTSTRLRTC